jgi:hypothetical protein
MLAVSTYMSRIGVAHKVVASSPAVTEAAVAVSKFTQAYGMYIRTVISLLCSPRCARQFKFASEQGAFLAHALKDSSESAVTRIGDRIHEQKMDVDTVWSTQPFIAPDAVEKKMVSAFVKLISGSLSKPAVIYFFDEWLRNWSVSDYAKFYSATKYRGIGLSADEMRDFNGKTFSELFSTYEEIPYAYQDLCRDVSNAIQPRYNPFHSKLRDAE